MKRETGDSYSIWGEKIPTYLGKQYTEDYDVEPTSESEHEYEQPIEGKYVCTASNDEVSEWRL